MTSTAAPPAADRPAHYRLGKATWALILKEYQEGATAPFLAGKWRVSVSAVRAQITRLKSTKRDWGDDQAIRQAQAREAELEEARRNSPEAAVARLFDGVTLGGDQAADPGSLMRAAVLASGRAMTGRLWSEARALAALAESYARLAERPAMLDTPPPDLRSEDEKAEELAAKHVELNRRLDAILAQRDEARARQAAGGW